jgi:hypothetical protein
MAMAESKTDDNPRVHRQSLVVLLRSLVDTVSKSFHPYNGQVCLSAVAVSMALTFSTPTSAVFTYEITAFFIRLADSRQQGYPRSQIGDRSSTMLRD